MRGGGLVLCVQKIIMPVNELHRATVLNIWVSPFLVDNAFVLPCYDKNVDVKMYDHLILNTFRLQFLSAYCVRFLASPFFRV